MIQTDGHDRRQRHIGHPHAHDCRGARLAGDGNGELARRTGLRSRAGRESYAVRAGTLDRHARHIPAPRRVEGQPRCVGRIGGPDLAGARDVDVDRTPARHEINGGIRAAQLRRVVADLDGNAHEGRRRSIRSSSVSDREHHGSRSGILAGPHGEGRARGPRGGCVCRRGHHGLGDVGEHHIVTGRGADELCEVDRPALTHRELDAGAGLGEGAARACGWDIHDCGGAGAGGVLDDIRHRTLRVGDGDGDPAALDRGIGHADRVDCQLSGIAVRVQGIRQDVDGRRVHRGGFRHMIGDAWRDLCVLRGADRHRAQRRGAGVTGQAVLDDERFAESGHLRRHWPGLGQQADALGEVSVVVGEGDDVHRIASSEQIVGERADGHGCPRGGGDRVRDGHRELRIAHRRYRDSDRGLADPAERVRHGVPEAVRPGEVRIGLVGEAIGAERHQAAEPRCRGEAGHHGRVAVRVVLTDGHGDGHAAALDHPGLDVGRRRGAVAGAAGREGVDGHRQAPGCALAGLGESDVFDVHRSGRGDLRRRQIAHGLAGDVCRADFVLLRQLRIQRIGDPQPARGRRVGNGGQQSQRRAGEGRVVVEDRHQDGVASAHRRGVGPHGDEVLLDGRQHRDIDLTRGHLLAVGDGVGHERRGTRFHSRRCDPQPPAADDGDRQGIRGSRDRGLHGQERAGGVSVIAQHVHEHRRQPADRCGVRHRQRRAPPSRLLDLDPDLTFGWLRGPVCRLITDGVGPGHLRHDAKGSLFQIRDDRERLLRRAGERRVAIERQMRGCTGGIRAGKVVRQGVDLHRPASFGDDDVGTGGGRTPGGGLGILHLYPHPLRGTAFPAVRDAVGDLQRSRYGGSGHFECALPGLHRGRRCSGGFDHHRVALRIAPGTQHGNGQDTTRRHRPQGSGCALASCRRGIRLVRFGAYGHAAGGGGPPGVHRERERSGLGFLVQGEAHRLQIGRDRGCSTLDPRDLRHGEDSTRGVGDMVEHWEHGHPAGPGAEFGPLDRGFPVRGVARILAGALVVGCCPFRADQSDPVVCRLALLDVEELAVGEVVDDHLTPIDP